MADQITKSVRRIVKGMKDDPTGLGLADDYKGIGTSRGEAFINARGDVTGSGSNGSGEDKDEQPPSSTPDTGTPDDNDTGGGGGVNNGSDPADALTGDVDAVVPALETDTQVGTVTGTDPTTGDPMSFNPNTLEGIEYDSPPGWPNPDHGPVPTDWELGFEWQGSGAGGQSFATESQSRAWAVSNLVPLGYFLFSENPGNDFTYFKLPANIPPSWMNLNDTTYSWLRLPCSPTEGNQLCPLTAEGAADQTPVSDSNCAVVYDSAAGGYKGHENDPDCSAAQKIASDSIIIRSVDDPNKYYKFTRLADGGTKITEVDSGGVIITDSVIKTIDEGGRFGDVYPDTLDTSIK